MSVKGGCRVCTLQCGCGSGWLSARVRWRRRTRLGCGEAAGPGGRPPARPPGNRETPGGSCRAASPAPLGPRWSGKETPAQMRFCLTQERGRAINLSLTSAGSQRKNSARRGTPKAGAPGVKVAQPPPRPAPGPAPADCAASAGQPMGSSPTARLQVAAGSVRRAAAGTGPVPVLPTAPRPGSWSGAPPGSPSSALVPEETRADGPGGLGRWPLSALFLQPCGHG